MERRTDENKALRELVDSLKDFIAARDSLWSLGFFDRIFRFSRCIAMLNRYDLAWMRVAAAVRAVQAAGASQSEAKKPDTGKKSPAPGNRPLLSMEEFEMLLGKPAILKKRSRSKSFL